MTRAAPWLWAALLASALGLAAVLVHGGQRERERPQQAAHERELGRLWALDAKLNEDLLEARAGLVAHYDQLVEDLREARELYRSLCGAAPADVDGGVQRARVGGGALDDELARLGELLEAKEREVERFKGLEAVLRNSRLYFPGLLERFRERLPGSPEAAPLRAASTELLEAMLAFHIAPSEDASALLASLEELSRARAQAAALGLELDVDLLLAHGRTIARRQPEVDALVHGLLRLPLGEQVAELAAAHAALLREEAAMDELSRRVSHALGVAVIVCAMALVIARLRQSARALARAGDELRAANHALFLERERERELGELKTRFVSMTSHEFRTPLSTILSSSELLARYGDRWDGERRATHLGNIRSSALDMTRMLEEILLIGRAEAGMLSPAPAWLDLGDWLERLIEGGRFAAESQRIRRRIEGDPQVWLDERLLTHVAANLLDNALKYSPAGSEVSLELEAGAASCTLVVSDAGIGIPEQDRARLFQSFHRGSNVGTIRGSGLGLSVVQRVVEVQGGSIRVESQVGAGSRFSVSLPLARDPHAAPAALAS